MVRPKVVLCYIEHRRSTLAGRALALLPWLSIAPDLLHDPLDLAAPETVARADNFRWRSAFQVGRLVAAFQTDQFGQGGRIGHFQTQGGIGGMVAL
ncbi:MAG: hypothetical protein KIS67_28785 [Verrucomicrobiae bacterium]|nr:hypothetical protein [Verrucomicrobiae bacterium]